MKIEKILENRFNGQYNKYYDTRAFTYRDLARLISESEIEVLFVDVDEGVERDMQSVSRHYGLDEFIDLSGYIESAAYDRRRLMFTFVGSLRGKHIFITVGAYEEPLITLTSEEELEIKDILALDD